MAAIVGIAIVLALFVGVIVCAVRFRKRRRENKPYDMIDMGVIAVVPIALLAAVIIPMLNR